MRYIYLGDAMTDPSLINIECNPVLRPDGKCIVSVKMATALVQDATGQRYVVKRRRLRLKAKLEQRSYDPRNGFLRAERLEYTSSLYNEFHLVLREEWQDNVHRHRLGYVAA
jgi:hypothetical protein